MNTKIKVAMVVMAAVMMLGTSAVAFAQTPTPPTPPTSPTPGQTFWQTLADKLGVTLDKLQQAVRDTLTDMLSQALKDGKLTQEQADKAQAGIDKMTFDKPPFGQFWGAGRRMALRAEFVIGKEALDAAAQKLGMTTQDLMTELRGGKTLADVAKGKNVSTDDLKAALVAAINAKLDQAVKDGNLTQAQADKVKAQVDKMSLDQSFGMGMRRDRSFGPGKDGFRGNRLFGPWGDKAPQPTTP